MRSRCLCYVIAPVCYGFFRSVFWWTGVASPHTPASGADAFEKLVFGSDVFGGDVQEFDLALARYHAMLDACQVPQSAQTIFFPGRNAFCKHKPTAIGPTSIIWFCFFIPAS